MLVFTLPFLGTGAGAIGNIESHIIKVLETSSEKDAVGTLPLY